MGFEKIKLLKFVKHSGTISDTEKPIKKLIIYCAHEGLNSLP